MIIGQIVTLINNRGLSSNLLPIIEDTISIIVNVLGINLNTNDISSSLKQLIKRRAEARRSRNWDLSDKLRDELKEKGLIIKDIGEDQIWQRV
jgi:cysteinyl-tRNA synthetase